MKKLIGIISAICMIALQSTTFAADNLYFNEGGITIRDNAPTVRPQEKVTLLVTPSSVDWLDADAREEYNGEDIIYFGEATVANNGEYSFNFYLPQNGKYNLYITEGNEPTLSGKPSLVKQIIYINKTDYAEAVLALEEAVQSSTDSNTRAIAQVLNNYREELGLCDEIFEDENLSYEDTAKISYGELEDLTEYEPLQIVEIFKKCAISSMLNDNYEDAISEYGYILYDNSLYEESDAQEVYDYMKDKDIQSIEELDKLANEAIVLAKANSGDSSMINTALKEVFAKKLYPRYAGKISAKMCGKISEKNNWTFETLKNYIANYSEPATSGPSVSQGGGGGGVASPGKSNQVKQEIAEFMPFNDVADVKWAHEAIIGLYNKGCISGRADGIFSPNDNISREEFLKILITMFDLELIGAEELPFEDTSKDAWYYSYVKTAYLAGVTNGISDTMFGIGQNITRQDLCKMTVNLMDALDKKLEETRSIAFGDDSQIADYAKDAVYILANAGIVSGNEKGEFKPFANATRAEAAKILYYTMTLVR